MTDVHEPSVRSFNMSRIKSKNTKPELIVRKFLFAQGLRFRLHAKELPGKPDLVFPKYKTVVFVNGCFWHHHENCKFSKIPETRKDFWESKILRTTIKDQENWIELTNLGWRVIKIWECELKAGKRQITLENLVSLIKIENA